MTSQQQNALDRANELRCERAARRRAIAAKPASEGFADLADLVESAGADGPYRTLRLVDALQWVRGVGGARADRLVGECLPHARRVRTLESLTERERCVVARQLRREADTARAHEIARRARAVRGPSVTPAEDEAWAELRGTHGITEAAA